MSDSDLYDIWSAATDDSAKREAFFKLLLGAQLFIPLARPHEPAPPGEEEAPLHLLLLTAGDKRAVAIFDRLDKLLEWAEDPGVAFIEMTGTGFFRLLSDDIHVVLDPLRQPQCVFYPEDVGYLRMRSTLDVENSDARMLEYDVAEDVPEGLVESLQPVFDNHRPLINAAYLLNVRERDTMGNLHQEMLGLFIDTTADEASFKTLRKALDPVLEAHVEDMPIALFPLTAGQSELAERLRAEQRPIYPRPN